MSILPLEMLGEVSSTEKSCWETSSLESLAKSSLDFTFTTGLQHVVTVEPEMTVACDIAYLPKRCPSKMAIWMVIAEVFRHTSILYI